MHRKNKFIDELFELAEKKPKCPHIKRDSEGRPYCGKDFHLGSEISDSRRAVCDTASLQLYCLGGPERHKFCIYYNGEALD